jgi:predicted Zn-dependent peptidase
MRYFKTRLKSGLRLITVPMKGTKTVTVLVVVAAGSKYETKSINGISHFLEHMMFKGTDRRPSTLAIAEELDSIGGEYNALTSKEWTGYYAKADSGHFDLILDIISDIFLNSKFEAQEIEREKGVILEEMNMYQDTPVRYIDDLIEELLYGDTSQGWKVIGEAKMVQGLNRQKLKKYFKERYVAKNTVVIVAGDVKIKNQKSKIKNYFTDIGKQDNPTLLKLREDFGQSTPQTRVYYKKTDQTHLALALRAYRAGHIRLPGLKILNIILGGNMSSRLFINIREREGLCYYINSQIQTYRDCGYLLVKAGVDNKRTSKALNLILKELRQISNGGISQSDIKGAKDYIRGKIALSLETSNDLAFWVAGQEMVLDRIKTPEMVLREVERVSINQVKKIAGDVIKDKGLNLMVIGPYKDQSRFTKLLQI